MDAWAGGAQRDPIPPEAFPGPWFWRGRHLTIPPLGLFLPGAGSGSGPTPPASPGGSPALRCSGHPQGLPCGASPGPLSPVSLIFLGWFLALPAVLTPPSWSLLLFQKQRDLGAVTAGPPVPVASDLRARPDALSRHGPGPRLTGRRVSSGSRNQAGPGRGGPAARMPAAPRPPALTVPRDESGPEPEKHGAGRTGAAGGPGGRRTAASREDAEGGRRVGEGEADEEQGGRERLMGGTEEPKQQQKRKERNELN